jgi:hypothetical protein
VSVFLALALLASPAPIFPKERCIDPKLEENIGMCKWLHSLGLEELKTAESVGVGVGNDIDVLRGQAGNCGLIYRVDFVGTEVAIIDILNADEEGKACMLSWIRAEAPNLEFSEERLDELLQDQPHSGERLPK